MTDYLRGNLELLARRQPELVHALSVSTHDRIEVFPSIKGLPTARYKRSDSQSIPLHSRYEPLQEAKKALENTDLLGADYFIILGFGLGYVLEALLERDGSEECHYFVVESDLEILKAALAARDFRPAFTRCHIHFAWPAHGPALADQWRGFFDPVGARKSVVVTHPPSLSINPALFRSAAEVIQSQTFQIFTDINTLVEKAQVFLDNFVQNLPRAISSPGVSEYVGRLEGIPAVLVAAGPSLDKNINDLRGCEEKVLILAADTALKPLLAAGVEPHLVLTGDPTYANYLHLRDAKAGNALLVAEVTAYPRVFEDFAARTITCAYANSSLGCLTNLLGNKGTLRAWGSVATMGLDFALTLRCNPIIFVGQDLAHSDGRTYCSGVYFEEKWFSDIAGPEEWRRRWENIRADKKVFTVEDLYGKPIETTDKLSAYWNWISKELRNHPDVTFINATEGGILRETVAVCSLREAMYRHSLPGSCPGRIVRAIFDGAKRQKGDTTDRVLVQLRQESARIARSLSEGTRLCRRDASYGSSELLMSLDSIRESIYAGRHLAPLLDSFNQMGNVTFLRKRGALDSIPGDSRPGDEIRSVYGEYFDSVGEALGRLDTAFDRLQHTLSADRT